MKEKILTFVIGALVGAIVATGVFLIINNNSPKGQKEMMGGRPEMGKMQMDENFTPGEPPSGEMQNGEKTQGGQKAGKNNNANSSNTSNLETEEKKQTSNSNTV